MVAIVILSSEVLRNAYMRSNGLGRLPDSLHSCYAQKPPRVLIRGQGVGFRCRPLLSGGEAQKRYSSFHPLKAQVLGIVFLGYDRAHS